MGKGSFFSRIGGTLSKFWRALVRFSKGRDLPVFVLCFVLAFFFWWSRTMSGTYEYDLQYEVRLTGVPSDIRLASDVTSPLKVSVSGKGSALWKEKIRRGKILEVDARSFHASASAGRAVLASVLLKDTISSMLPASVIVRETFPDTLSYNFFVEKIVKVPVRFGGTFQRTAQFRPETVIFNPDSVIVGVPQNESAAFSQVLTEAGDFVIESGTTTLQLNLQCPENAVLYTDKVTVTVQAAQYTEKTLDVPVQGIGFPEGTLLKTFPSKVKLTFLVRISDFDRIGPDDFLVAADYSALGQVGNDRAELRLLQQPAGVENVRMVPQVVEYITETMHR